MSAAYVNFDCPQCGQNLDAPQELAGLFTECPACDSIVKVPMSLQPTPAPVPAPQPVKTPVQGIYAPAPQQLATAEEKSTTVRIQVPTNIMDVPRPQLRRIFIKRPGT